MHRQPVASVARNRNAPGGSPSPSRQVAAGARSGAASPPVYASPNRPPRPPPPWATHGETLRAAVDSHHAVARTSLFSEPPDMRGGRQHVQFRGTESLASLHLIDQDLPPGARLSQRMSTLGSTGFGERTMLPKTVHRLPPVEEARERSSVPTLSATAQKGSSMLRASSLGRSEQRRKSEDHGRQSSAPTRSRPSSTGAPALVAAGGGRGNGVAARGAQPPWLVLPTSSRRPSRDQATREKQPSR
eukprot:TRINITY_DN28401_c1_g2_i1.p1 TRINITY_DN28401_c1_g2~~TRINITY_DN28401_c1_g2_i1.p1  ORF type:complete len:245 (-),score=36.95 TRINITY_DN28401_c1_g2_i1:230-964(-)